MFFTIFLLFLCLLSSSSPLSCLPCCSDQETGLQSTKGPLSCTTCPPLSASECKSGQLTKDVCFCCDVCAKAEGETCGGPWNLDGVCADDLVCDKSKDYGTTPLVDDFNASGVCKFVTLSPGVDCCSEKLVKSTGEKYILESNPDMKALKSCVDECVYRKEGDQDRSLYCFEKGSLEIQCK